MVLICDICKKRSAVYRREYSGQNLCKICLNRTIERSIKRSIAEAGILSPGDTIAIPITLSLPQYSQLIADILPHIEKKYNSKTIILIPRIFEKMYVPRTGNYEIIDVNLPRKVFDPIDCIRYDRAWSIHYARSLGIDAVAFPLTRTHSTLIGLEALLRGRPEAFHDSLVVIDSQPPVFNPLINLEAETVVASLYTRNIEPIAPACKAEWLSKSIYKSVAPGRPELAYSSSKLLPRLANLTSRSTVRCSVCGGYSGTPICESCRRTGALRFLSL